MHCLFVIGREKNSRSNFCDYYIHSYISSYTAPFCLYAVKIKLLLSCSITKILCKYKISHEYKEAKAFYWCLSNVRATKIRKFLLAVKLRNISRMMQWKISSNNFFYIKFKHKNFYVTENGLIYYKKPLKCECKEILEAEKRMWIRVKNFPNHVT